MESFDGKLFSFGASVECITDAVEDATCSDESVWKKIESVEEVFASKWFQDISQIPLTNQQMMKITFFCRQLDEIVVRLWNAIVFTRSSTNLTPKTLTSIRLLCFKLITCNLFNISGKNSTETYRNRILMMGVKTAKSQLDLKEFSEAERILSSLMPQVVGNEQLMSYQAKIGCYLLGAYFHLGRYDAMEAIMKQLKTLEHADDTLITCVSYNLGLKAATDKLLEKAENLLKFSLEIGQKVTNNNANNAKTLRLLAHVQWESGNSIEALKSAESSHLLFNHPASSYLMLRINCECDNVDGLKALLGDLLQHPELDIAIALSACRYLNRHHKYQECDWGLEQLSVRFKTSQHISRIIFERFNASMTRLPRCDRLQFAQTFLRGEEILQCYNDNDVRKLFQALLWQQAANCRDMNDWESSITWYEASRPFFATDDVTNIAKLLRNKCSCFLELGQVAQAEEAAEEAVMTCPRDVLSNFFKLKVQIAKSDQEAAAATIDVMMTSCDEPVTSDVTDDEIGTKLGLVCLAAQIAFERDQRDVAVAALRHMCMMSSVEERLVAHRLLTRLYLTSQKKDDFAKSDFMQLTIGVINDALELLKETKMNENLKKETDWFMRVAWNVALDVDEDYVTMKRLFGICFELLKLLPKNENILLRMKACSIMRIGSSLSIALRQDDRDDVTCFSHVLSEVLVCRDICRQLNDVVDDVTDRSFVLLLLYQLSASCKLHRDQANRDIDDVFQQLLRHPAADISTFETVAAVALERPGHQVALCKSALTSAIAKIDEKLQQQSDDKLIARRSNLSRYLIELSINEANHADVTSYDDAWRFANDVYRSLQNDVSKQRDDDALWLTVKSWNVGIQLLGTSSDGNVAEKWCSFAIQVLSRVSDVTRRSTLETHMTSAYGEVLSRKDKLIK